MGGMSCPIQLELEIQLNQHLGTSLLSGWGGLGLVGSLSANKGCDAGRRARLGEHHKLIRWTGPAPDPGYNSSAEASLY